MSSNNEIEKFLRKRKGLPRNLEKEICVAMIPILKRYKNTYMNSDRIAGITSITIRELCGEYLWKK